MPDTDTIQWLRSTAREVTRHGFRSHDVSLLDAERVINAERDRALKVAPDALRDISNTDLFDYSADGSADYYTEATGMVDIAAKALREIPRTDTGRSTDPFPRSPGEDLTS